MDGIGNDVSVSDLYAQGSLPCSDFYCRASLSNDGSYGAIYPRQLGCHMLKSTSKWYCQLFWLIMWAYICICKMTRIYKYQYAFDRDISIYIYMYICICIHVCIYIYIHIYIYIDVYTPCCATQTGSVQLASSTRLLSRRSGSLLETAFNQVSLSSLGKGSQGNPTRPISDH